MATEDGASKAKSAARRDERGVQAEAEASKQASKKKQKPPRQPSALELLLQERGLIPGENGVKRDAFDDRIDELEKKLGSATCGMATPPTTALFF